MYGAVINKSLSANNVGDPYFDTEKVPSSLKSTEAYKKIFSVLTFLFIGVFSIIGIALLYPDVNNSSRNVVQTAPKFNSFSVPSYSELVLISTDMLDIVASNEYGIFEGPYSFITDTAGSKLIEPYKKSLIEVTGIYAEDSIYRFEWVVEGSTDILFGSSVDIVKTTPGTYTLQIHVFHSTMGYTATFTTKLFCKYVKREIRSLTEADREKMLDAMHAMWEYTTAEGSVKFGSKFTSIQDFVAIHSIASNDIRCDQFHEGSGFLTHHLALTNSFEASMRAVDPTVTLHYWDFTIEGQSILLNNQLPRDLLTVSPLFSHTWFGSVDESNHISNSRWAHSLMPRATSESETHNSYGYIRSYWNNNPDPEVTRHMFDVCGSEPVNKAIPHCAFHYSLLNSKNLATMQLLSPADGHGPMHVHLGGMFGDCQEGYADFITKWGDYMNEDLTAVQIEATGLSSSTFLEKWGTTAQRRKMFEKAVMGEYFHIYRSLYRSHMCAVDNLPNYLECPASCDPKTTPLSKCACKVNKLLSGETDWKNLYPCMLNSEDNRNDFSAMFPEDALSDMVTFIATTPLVEGEMIESASTADVLFWMIHPVMERLLAAKRMKGVNDMAGSVFSEWEVIDGSEETFLEYSYYSLETGQNKYYPEEYTCVGHAATDSVLPYKLPFTDVVDDNADIDKDGVVSNWEFLLFLNPNNADGMDYVFDNFRWDHCANMQLIDVDMSLASLKNMEFPSM